jgi:hypothetical protein
MANSTIPGLVAVSVPALTDLFGVRQSGDSRDKKLTVTQLLTLIPSGGDVTKVGTPADNQLGVWTGDGTIEGTNDLTFSGGVFNVVTSNEMRLTGELQLQGSDRPSLMDEASSLTNPTLVPSGGGDTGIGGGGGSIAVIADGLAGMALVELAGGVYRSYETSRTVTAFAGGGQASATLLINSNSIVTTVATTGDSVKLPTVSELGAVFFIKNDGANACDVFPGSGKDIGAGVDVAISLAAGTSVSYTNIGSSNMTAWIVSPSGGDLTKVGTPVNNQLGIWTGDGTLEGDPDIQYDGNTFTMNLSGGDFRLTGKVELQGANRPAMQDESSSNTNPTLLPLGNSPLSGLGGQGSSVSLIAQSKGAIVCTGLNSQILQGFQANPSVTAFAGGGQGSAVILGSTYNVLGTVATTGDSVKLPILFVSGDPATIIFIKNDGANAADVFPGSGDDLGAGVDTAISLAAGESVSYFATAGSTWTPWIIDTKGSGGAQISGTPANNQLGVWVNSTDIEGDSNWQIIGTLLRSALGNGPGMVNLDGVNILPRHGDPNTGLQNVGDDRLAMVAGGVQGITLIEASSAVLPTYQTNVGITAFATGGQTSATELRSGYNVVTTVATTGDSVKFTSLVNVGSLVYLKNNGANALDLFPAGGDDLGLGVGVAISVPAGASVAFLGSVLSSTWTQLIFEAGGGGGIAAVVDDPSPQLGGDLDTNGSNILNADTTLPGISITAGTDPADEGGDLDLSSGDSGVGATGDAGALNILAGSSLATAGDGGVLSIKSGAGIGTGAGGDILVEVGEGGAPGPGTSGNLFINTLTGANAAAGLQVPLPGLVSIYGIGRSGEGPAGNLELWGGYANGTGGGSIGGDAIMWGGGQGGGTGVGGNARLIGGESDNNPGFAEIKGGTATVDGQGGQVNILGGPGFGTNRSGGLVTIDGGLGIGTGSGQRVDITGGVSGSGATGNGGDLHFFGGSAASTNGSGGDILLGGGTETGSGVQGTVDIDNGSLFRIVGPVNTNHVSMAHDNTDMNWIGTSTTDWNISGITALNAGSMDAAFARLILPSGSSAGAPELKIGSGQTGFFASSATQLRITVNGTERFTVTNDIIQGFLAGSGQLHNRVSSATVPTFTPNTNDGDTGIGRAGTDQLSLIAGGVEIARLTEAAEDQFIISPGALLGSAALPALAFGDGDSGFNEALDDNIQLSLVGTVRWFWEVDSFNAAVGTGPAMLNEVPSGTNPTLIANRSDSDTGIGSAAVDQLSLVAGGVEMLRCSEAAADQILIIAGTAAAPALSFFADPDSGLYSVVPGIVAMSVDATDRFRWVGNQFRGAVGGSPSIQNEVASATNPTLLPSQTDLDTGIGRTGTDQLALVAGGLDCMTVRETGAARQIGFYTTAPISQQTGVAVTDVAIHAALVALGLITA